MHRITRDKLLNKLNNIGAPLSENWNIYTGCIVLLKDSQFIIDNSKRQQLIANNARTDEIIECVLLRSQEKWKTESAYVIKILSSSKERYRWSKENDETEAEKTFEKTYQAIHAHLKYDADGLKKRADKGKFWWELKSHDCHPKLYQPKIVYSSVPRVNHFMQAAYDKVGILTQDYLHSILPADLHLLAILNSKLFNWYAGVRFNKSKEKLHLNLCKKNMEQMPIAAMTTEQKVNLSLLVHQILNNPNNPNNLEVPNIEREIDQLVYKLYKLTDAEIALIEEESNP